MALYFYTEDGLSAVSPGVFVTVNDSFGNLVGTGWTFADGSVAIPVQGAVPYTASFRSTQLTAGLTASFFGNALPGADTVVAIPGATPTLFSQAGGAAFLFGELPKGWFPTGDPGAFAITSGIAGGLTTMDASIARLIASIRGQTARGPDLDTWAAQLYGNYLRRYPGEDDATFYALLVALTGQRRTLLAIKNAVIAFYTATLQERIQAATPNLVYDESGEIDVQGAYDVFVPPPSAAALTPVVDVWDAMSQPTLAAQYSVSEPQFVVQIGFTGLDKAWFLDRSALDVNTFLLDEYSVTQSQTAPDPRLASLVSLVKAAGTRPIYLVTSTL